MTLKDPEDPEGIGQKGGLMLGNISSPSNYLGPGHRGSPRQFSQLTKWPAVPPTGKQTVDVCNKYTMDSTASVSPRKKGLEGERVWPFCVSLSPAVKGATITVNHRLGDVTGESTRRRRGCGGVVGGDKGVGGEWVSCNLSIGEIYLISRISPFIQSSMHQTAPFNPQAAGNVQSTALDWPREGGSWHSKSRPGRACCTLLHPAAGAWKSLIALIIAAYGHLKSLAGWLSAYVALRRRVACVLSHVGLVSRQAVRLSTYWLAVISK
ncbi:hypothetical protein B0H63DRAFT_75088 [Podospora didyma]|uniref:Uncharacterized protein n=1 Tax=Podospora didyma TaxID=330526 RepID=A0AAE0K2S9_9PEZI|nr:hypothetical protein B0H63DRAFT_75088 [Podospora didyma]